MSHGGVNSGNPGNDPQILPWPNPPFKSHDGYCDTSTSTDLKITDVDETLPGYETSAMPRPASSDAEYSSINHATASAIAVATGNGATVDDPLANDINMNESNDGAKANPSTKLEALRAQGQALTSTVQALLMQMQALNSQIDSLL